MSDFNPYQAPEAVIFHPSKTEGNEELVVQPRACSWGRGWGWIVEAFELFKREPWLWVGMFVVYILITLAVQVVLGVMSIIPIIGMVFQMVGSVITNMMGPLFVGGLMISARSLDRDGILRFEDLFAGFREQTMNLALVGLLYLGLVVALTMIFIIILVAIGAVLAVSMGGVEGITSFFQNLQNEPLLLTSGILLFVLVFIAILMPLLMAYWFAPVLVALHGISPWEAMKLSFRGCLKNMGPFLVYGVIGLLFLIPVPFTLFLGLLVYGPVMTLCYYTAYREIFLVDYVPQS